jgi:hypothetical protein
MAEHQVVMRQQPRIAYPHAEQHAMATIELGEAELDALASISRWSPIIAQSLLDCELGTPLMLALRELMGLKLAAIEDKRGGAVRPVYVDESGIVWRVTCGTMIGTLESVGRTSDGRTFVHVIGKKVQATVEWPLGSQPASRTAANVLSISGPQVA